MPDDQEMKKIDPEMKVVADTLAKPDDYEIERFLSTDGKHTVRYSSSTPEGRRKGMIAQEALYEYTLKKYGSKADMWGEVMNGKRIARKPTEVKNAQAACPHELTTVKEVFKGDNKGKYYHKCNNCSAFVRWAKVE